MNQDEIVERIMEEAKRRLEHDAACPASSPEGFQAGGEVSAPRSMGCGWKSG